ncbi:MAG: NAAT family transporter [Burkholderiales bacterium]|nr:NAAT family transporter [Burkholderiales bacterium]
MDVIKSFISLLVLINPIGALPVFISLTANQSVAEKRRTIRIASIAVASLLVGTALVGDAVLNFFGIEIASFQVAGGILILLVGLSMVNAQPPTSRQTREEQEEAEHKANVAVVPLAIPLLAGPGAMSTVIIYADRVAHWYQLGWLVGAGVLLGVLTWLTLNLAVPISRVLGKTGINIATRLMGLLLMAISVEFMVDGLTKLLPILKGAA